MAAMALVPRAAEPAPPFPLRQVTLFSSGIGLLERRATVNGSGELTFRISPDRMDDVITTMQVVDPSGSRVAPLSRWAFQNPLLRLQKDFSATLTGGEGILTVLSRLRGASVRILRPPAPPLSGRLSQVIPYDARRHPSERGPALVLTGSEGDLTMVPWRDVAGIELLESDLATRLARNLAVLGESLTGSDGTLVLQLGNGGAREVSLTYLTALPAWNVTYRLDVKGDAATLRGMATVHNPTQEDWQNVRLNLVSGSPLSFRYPLSVPGGEPVGAGSEARGAEPEGELSVSDSPVKYFPSKIPWPTVDVSVQDATGEGIPGVTVTISSESPASFHKEAETSEEGKARFPGLFTGTYSVKAELEGFTPYVIRKVHLVSMQDTRISIVLHPAAMSETMEVTSRETLDSIHPAKFRQALRKQMGELASFRIQRPISIPSQSSALVPFLEIPVDVMVGAIALVGGPSDKQSEPVQGLHLANRSEVRLAGGPCAIYSNGVFQGETRIPDLIPGQSTLISYGPGPKLTLKRLETTTATSALKDIQFYDHGLNLETRGPEIHCMQIDNSTGAPCTVLLLLNRFERPFSEFRPHSGMSVADYDSCCLLRLTAPPGVSKHSLKGEVLTQSYFSNLDALPPAWKTLLASSPLLSPSRRQAVNRLMELGQNLRRMEAEMKVLEERIGQHTADQQRLRGHLNALSEVTGGSALATELVARLNTIETAIRTETDRRDQLENHKKGLQDELEPLWKALTLPASK